MTKPGGGGMCRRNGRKGNQEGKEKSRRKKEKKDDVGKRERERELKNSWFFTSCLSHQVFSDFLFTLNPVGHCWEERTHTHTVNHDLLQEYQEQVEDGWMPLVSFINTTWCSNLQTTSGFRF